jgi:hypothetical protein
MPALTDLQSRLDALKAQRDSAVARVSYDGRSVEYRGATDLSHAIAELEREIAVLEGKGPIRQCRGVTCLGL